MTATRTRRPLSAAKQAELTAEREAKTAEAAKILEDAVAALMTSDGWQAMIEARLWLRKYSFSNLMLIMMQCPGATDVRPYGARVNPSPNSWKAVGRFARPGSSAIRIYAPLFRKNSDGDQEIYGFKLVPVFDVSQTDGEPLPPVVDTNVQLLTGEAPAELWERTEKLIIGLGYSVQRGPCEGFPTANGLTEFGPKRVTVRADIDDAQASKTLIHELAHIMLGHGAERNDITRDQCEVEAESVACIVTRNAGLVSLSYSVGYVAGWAQTPDLVEASAKIVLKVSNEISAALEPVVVIRSPEISGDPPEERKRKMKIYLATRGEYSDFDVVKAFRNEEDAKSYEGADDVLILDLEEGPVEMRTEWAAEAQFHKNRPGEVTTKEWDSGKEDYDPDAGTRTGWWPNLVGDRVVVHGFDRNAVIRRRDQIIEDRKGS